MRTSLLPCVLSLVLLAGLGASQKIVQSQQYSSVRQDQPVSIPCLQQGSDAYMYWYRQLPGQGLQDVLYAVHGENATRSDGITDRFFAKKTADNRFDLKIGRVKQSDAARYFCACSEAQRYNRAETWDKNPPVSNTTNQAVLLIWRPGVSMEKSSYQWQRESDLSSRYHLL
ncbi:hypothetical protein scyTo_0004490 [Scyliorhinus torazame]|uniref:Ig-like domain-containing protein n=1 Tax=Scyliorhinus torazame TaxID=75743 RepID=A0A401NSH9_SCYTO|nr:hypothetical protein [Scyliorhinus torazame]